MSGRSELKEETCDNEATSSSMDDFPEDLFTGKFIASNRLERTGVKWFFIETKCLWIFVDSNFYRRTTIKWRHYCPHNCCYLFLYTASGCVQ